MMVCSLFRANSSSRPDASRTDEPTSCADREPPVMLPVGISSDERGSTGFTELGVAFQVVDRAAFTRRLLLNLAVGRGAVAAEEFDAIFERIKQAGIRYGNATDGFGETGNLVGDGLNMKGPDIEPGARGEGRSLYFGDPSGHSVEIMTYD